MYNLIISLIFIIGTSLHIYFLQINQIVKTSIGFENIKLINDFKNLSFNGFGDGTIGFLYSLLITPIDLIIKNHLLSAQILNIMLLILSGFLLFTLGKKYLHPTYNILMIIIFFISPNIIYYTDKISNINLIISLFLLLILAIHELITETSIKSMNVKVGKINVQLNNNKDIIIKSILVGVILSLLFFTINIYIIYLIAMLIILGYFFLLKKISLKILLISYIGIIGTFLIFISPYIYISGLNGNTNYFSSTIINNKIINIQKNNLELFIKKEKKIFLNILPKITLGNAIDSYRDKNFIFYNNKIFLVFSLIPILFFLFGIYKLFLDKKVYLTEKRNLLPILFSTFFILSIFTGLFLSEDQIFIIFLPIIILIMCFGAQNFIKFNMEILSAIKLITIALIIISIYVQGNLQYLTYNNYNDLKYENLKKIGLWLKENKEKNSKILSILPTVSYYSGKTNTWVFLNKDNIEDIISYAQINKINYLVANSFTLNKYKPQLKYLIEDSFKNSNIINIKEISKIGQKTILYKFNY